MLLTALRSTLSLSRSTALAPRLIAARFLTQEARAHIQSAIASTPVVLFMKGTPAQPECGFSRAVIQVLELQQVPADKLKTFNVLADPELRSGIKEFSDWPTVPQLYVNGEFVGGCDILLTSALRTHPSLSGGLTLPSLLQCTNPAN
ncbi:thioredoxin-like protein [Mycena rosella]|uniref:Monothiol glutaredoxin-5, mitochondrial n=1 Tax=Mycena rosella TaxID=1033263 RepID=A0AAD7BMC1_MYCRO|nr:thioredoxin-like protein [Mycena rosella]